MTVIGIEEGQRGDADSIILHDAVHRLMDIAIVGGKQGAFFREGRLAGRHANGEIRKTRQTLKNDLRLSPQAIGYRVEQRPQNPWLCGGK